MTDARIQSPDLPTQRARNQLVGDQVPAMVFDAARYQHLLDDPTITPEESATFLKAIWDIIVLVLDFGLRLEFGEINPQGAEKHPKALDAVLGNMLSYEHSDLIDKNNSDAVAKGRTVKGCFDESSGSD